MNKLISNSGSSWLAEFSILAIIGFTPIFFNYFYPTSIDLSKIVVFRIFTLLLFFAVVWRFSEFKLGVAKNILKRLLPFILLFIFLIVSLFFSVDIVNSWFGSYDRQEGLISWLFYGLFALLVTLHLESKTEPEKNLAISRLFTVASMSGFLVSLYAIFQLFGWDFITWSEPAALTGRAVSSLGQPNYLACWLLIVLPFSAYLLYKTKNKLNRLIWSIFFLSELIALFSTGSRSAFLVFLIISILWFFWFLSYKKILSRRKIFVIILSGIGITLLFISFLFISNPNRFKELSDFKRGSAYVRLELWQNGLQAIYLKPFFGYGLENQKEIYVKYYKVDSAVYARPDTYSDRAHNLILDFALTSGIIGLGFFIYFLYWVYLNLWQAFKNNKNHELPAFLLWSLTVYLASLLFNFSVTVTNIYFWLIVAVSLSLFEVPLITFKNDKKNPELTHLVLVLGAVILFAYGSIVEIQRLEADYYYNKALEATNSSEYFSALVLKSYIDKIYLDKVTQTFYNEGLALRLIESLPKIEDKSNIFAIKEYLGVISKSTLENNFENNFVKACILGTLGHQKESDNIFENLSFLSPNLPKIYLAWGDVLLYNHNYLGAKVKFEQALNLLPNLNNSYMSGDQRIRLEFYRAQIIARLTKITALTK